MAIRLPCGMRSCTSKQCLAGGLFEKVTHSFYHGYSFAIQDAVMHIKAVLGSGDAVLHIKAVLGRWPASCRVWSRFSRAVAALGKLLRFGSQGNGMHTDCEQEATYYEVKLAAVRLVLRGLSWEHSVGLCQAPKR
eukprot:1161517-Pelagomonas_calceolata.AAC.10